MAEQTGWIRYVINGRGGGGKDKWIYSPGMDHPEVDREDIRDHILYNHETWAIHAESYTLEYHLGELPPAKIIHAQLFAQNQNLGFIQGSIAALEEQLRKVNTLVIVVGEPSPEGVDVHIDQLQAIEKKAIAKSGQEAVTIAIKKYTPDGTTHSTMVKDFDALYADLKVLSG